jgi:hypothetical protein
MCRGCLVCYDDIRSLLEAREYLVVQLCSVADAVSRKLREELGCDAPTRRFPEYWSPFEQDVDCLAGQSSIHRRPRLPTYIRYLSSNAGTSVSQREERMPSNGTCKLIRNSCFGRRLLDQAYIVTG